MTTKHKTKDHSEGMVKIVGVNHGLCLQTFLSEDGWKEEKFVDVVFLCIPQQSMDGTIAPASAQRRLKANRSVLAAASPFFATILPDCQQEEDYVISVEYTYEELFLILEYLYSGRLVCSEDKRDQILFIINELKINTSRHPEAHQSSEIPTDDNYSVVQPVIPDNGKDTEINSECFSNQAELATEKITLNQSKTQNTSSREELNGSSPSLNVKKYPSKKNVQRTMMSAINKQFTAKLLKNTGDSRTIEFTITAPVNRQSVTLEAYGQETGSNTSFRCFGQGRKRSQAVTHVEGSKKIQSSNYFFEQTVLKGDETTSESPQCNLFDYGIFTWDCGVYSPVELARQTTKPAKRDSKQHKAPQNNTTSTSRAAHLHARIAPEAQSRSNSEMWTPLSGFLIVPDHINNNAPSKAQVEEYATSSTPLEMEAENTDMALAEHFLQKEILIKKRFHWRIKLLSDQLNKFKDIARNVLSTKRKLEIAGPEICQSKVKPKPRIARSPCETCGKMLDPKMRRIHKLIHSGAKPYLCDHCGRAFSVKTYLMHHVQNQHEGLKRPKRFTCSTCGHSCYHKNQLEVHQRIHTGERPWDCKYCDKKFREKGGLVRHLRTHTGEKPYACNICGTAYAARYTYVQHYRSRHAPKVPKTSDGNDTNVDENMPRPHGTLYRCETCDKTFQRRLAYEKHIATHTGAAVALPCSQPGCAYTYSDIAVLKDHMLSFHPEKVFVCSICSKLFLHKQSLLDHEMRHDPAKHFRCSMCPKTVTTKKSLADHEKTHTRETPYECSVCDAKFHSPYLIDIHMRKHEPPRKRIRKRAVNPTDAPGPGVRITPK